MAYLLSFLSVTLLVITVTVTAFVTKSPFIVVTVHRTVRAVTMTASATTNTVTDSSSGELAQRVLSGLAKKFPASSVDRVIECFQTFNTGKKLDKLLGDGTSEHNRQQANCWVEGIQPLPFHNIYSKDSINKDGKNRYQWVVELEKKSNVIIKEFSQVMKQSSMNSKWYGSRNSEAGAIYGPQWKTLGLQDRSQWDAENVLLFPKTVKLLHSLNIPSCEVFFAKQDANSGITPHSDQNNFILTCHLGIQVAKDKAWIRVGDETQYWEEGKAMVFDTSIFHSTRNDAETDRYVLLIRFWHPDLTPIEVEALEYIFEFLNYAAVGEEALQEFEARSLAVGKVARPPPIFAPNVEDELLGRKKKEKKSSNTKGFGR